MVVFSIMLLLLGVSLFATYVMEILDIYLYCLAACFFMITLGYVIFQSFTLAGLFGFLTLISLAAIAHLRQVGIY